jgi:hypothetical protein
MKSISSKETIIPINYESKKEKSFYTSSTSSKREKNIIRRYGQFTVAFLLIIFSCTLIKQVVAFPQVAVSELFGLQYLIELWWEILVLVESNFKRKDLKNSAFILLFQNQ